MTYKQIEKEFDEKFCSNLDRYGGVCKTYMKNEFATDVAPVKSFLKQSFIKYLQETLKVIDEDLNKNAERGFPTSTVAKQWVLTQIKELES